MKKNLLTLSFLFPVLTFSQQKSITTDKDWSAKNATIFNTVEADLIIRLGDVDNLGFGWPEDFDPFCGKMTQSHSYPWDIPQGELDGFDRILHSSKYSAKVHPLLNGLFQ